MAPTQCTLAIATAALAVPSDIAPMVPAVITPVSIPRTPTLEASVFGTSTVPAAMVQAPITSAHAPTEPRAPAAPTSIHRGPTSTTRGRTSIHRGFTSTPRGRTSIHRGSTSTPRGRTSIHRGSTSTPRGRTSIHRGSTSTPRGRTSIHRGSTSTPRGRTSIHRGFTSTPRGFTSIPSGPTSTPIGSTSTPIGPTSTLVGPNSTPRGFTSIPSGPTSTPSGPTSTPSGPTYTPRGFTSIPSGPTSTPSGPTSTPSGPTSIPSGPTYTPRGFTSIPSGPTSTPSGPTYTPRGFTSIPSGPTSTPRGPTSTPSGFISIPSGPTSTPRGPTSTPSGFISIPSGPTSIHRGPTSITSDPAVRVSVAPAPIFIFGAPITPTLIPSAPTASTLGAPIVPAPVLGAPIAPTPILQAPIAPIPVLRDPMALALTLGGPMASTPIAPGLTLEVPMAPTPMASAPTPSVPMAPIAPAAPTSPMLMTPPASPSVMHPAALPSIIAPSAPSVPSESTYMNNAYGEKCFKERRYNKRPLPRPRSPDRTRLGSGVLRKINYCEDIPTEKSMHYKRQHIDADVDEADPPEVQAHKKRVKAGCTLEQHLGLLPQAAEGADYDASIVCGTAPLSITIEKTSTDSLVIYYWVDKAFATKWGKLLIECHAKDVLLSNQRGKKWRVQWNHELKDIDHTTTGWGTFVADHKLHDGDRCDLTVLHTAPIEFGFSFIRKPGSKTPGLGITRLLKNKPKEKNALEGLERGYGSEGDAIALDNRQHQYRSHFRFQPPMSDEGKFFYSSDCPGTYARVTPYPKRSRSGKRFQPYKKSQPGTSFEPGINVKEYIIQEFFKQHHPN